MKFNLNPRRRRLAAFSLPEVAIATAIAAVSLVTIVGLLPQGLKSVQRSSQVSTQARVVRQMLGELQLTNWGTFNGQTYSGLNTMMSQVSYFDGDGNKISGNTSMDELAYIARPVFPSQINPANQATHPTLPGSLTPSNSCMQILIQIVPTNDSHFDFSQADPSRYTVQPAILTRQFYTP